MPELVFKKKFWPAAPISNAYIPFLVLYLPNNFFWPAAADFWMLMFYAVVASEQQQLVLVASQPTGARAMSIRCRQPLLPLTFSEFAVRYHIGYMYIAYLSIKTFAGSANPLGPYYVSTL